MYSEYVGMNPNLVSGDMHDIITVSESPTNESLRTSVNLLPLNEMCPWSLSKALMHSFSQFIILSTLYSAFHLNWNTRPNKQIH